MTWNELIQQIQTNQGGIKNQEIYIQQGGKLYKCQGIATSPDTLQGNEQGIPNNAIILTCDDI